MNRGLLMLLGLGAATAALSALFQGKARRGLRSRGLGMTGREAYEYVASENRPGDPTAAFQLIPSGRGGYQSRAITTFPRACREAFEEGYDAGKVDPEVIDITQEEREEIASTAFSEGADHRAENIDLDDCSSFVEDAERYMLENIAEYVPNNYCEDSNSENFSEGKAEGIKEAEDEAEQKLEEAIEDAIEDAKEEWIAEVAEKAPDYEAGMKRGLRRWEKMRNLAEEDIVNLIAKVRGSLGAAEYTAYSSAGIVCENNQHALRMAQIGLDKAALFVKQFDLPHPRQLREAQLELDRVSAAFTKRCLRRDTNFAEAATRTTSSGVQQLNLARTLVLEAQCVPALEAAFAARDSFSAAWGALSAMDPIDDALMLANSIDRKRATQLVTAIAAECGGRASHALAPRRGPGVLEIEGPYRRRAPLRGLGAQLKPGSRRR